MATPENHKELECQTTANVLHHVEDSAVSSFLETPLDSYGVDSVLAHKTSLKRITTLKTQILVQNGLSRGRSESPRRRTQVSDDCIRRVDIRPMFKSRSLADIHCSREIYNRKIGSLVSAPENVPGGRPFCNNPVDRVGEFESLLSDL